MDLAGGLSDGLTMASDSLSHEDSKAANPEAPSGEESRRKIETKGAIEQYQKDYLDHVERNSAGYSTAAFSPRDLANHLVEASNQLEGEGKDNLKKLMDFIVKDGQVLFVSAFDKPGDAKSFKTFSKFAELLDRSYPMLKLRYEGNLKRILELKEEQRRISLQDRESVARGGTPTNMQRVGGIKNELRRIGKEMKDMRDKVFEPGMTAPTGPNNWGYTNAKSRRVVITDRTSNGRDKYEQGKPIDAKLIAKQMQETMEGRAGNPKLTQEEQAKTFFIAGRFAEGLTTNAYPYIYVHELGHQIHNRSGEKVVPSDSVSQGRGRFPNNNQGLSRYSNTDYHEAFAEAFAAFIFNPAALRQHDEPMYTWVKSSFEEAMQNAGVKLPEW